MIRPAHLADLAAVRTIEQNSATAAHWPEAAYLAILNGEDQRRILLVAESEPGTGQTAQIAGFAVAASLGTEWELENIVVAEAFQHRGLGTQLLAALVSRAKSAGVVKIHAEVRASNPAIENFYKRYSFRETGRRTKYYTLPQEDAVLISLLITGP